MSEEKKNVGVSDREVNITCRRSQDRVGRGTCDSTRALILASEGGKVSYRCVKCNYTWVINSGGALPFSF
jgi:transposase-like protein